MAIKTTTQLVTVKADALSVSKDTRLMSLSVSNPDTPPNHVLVLLEENDTISKQYVRFDTIFDTLMPLTRQAGPSVDQDEQPGVPIMASVCRPRHTNVPLKVMVVGTGSGRWLSIVPDRVGADANDEVMETPTIMVNRASTGKTRWVPSADMDTHVANAQLFITAPAMFNTLMKIVEAWFAGHLRPSDFHESRGVTSRLMREVVTVLSTATKIPTLEIE